MWREIGKWGVEYVGRLLKKKNKVGSFPPNDHDERGEKEDK